MIKVAIFTIQKDKQGKQYKKVGDFATMDEAETFILEIAEEYGISAGLMMNKKTGKLKTLEKM